MEIPRHWRLKKQRYGLVGEVFAESGRKILSGRPVDLGYDPGEKEEDKQLFNVAAVIGELVIANDFEKIDD
jgi:hypothetical protein